MSLATASRAAPRLGLLLLPLLGLPCIGLALAVLNGLRAEIGAADLILDAAANGLLMGMVASGFVAIEVLTFLLGRCVVRRAAMLEQVAAAGATLDFRRAPPPCDADELGRLATALGRTIRHLTRRRRELDWIREDFAGRPSEQGAASNDAARFAAEDPATATVWLDAPLHRLLCALAGGVVCLAVASIEPIWWGAAAAAALLGGRQAERLRRFGSFATPLTVTGALVYWLLSDSSGPAAATPALLVALAAGLAVHFGGGWRGPGGIAADVGWLRGGLAGALAGGGVAAALIGVLGPGPAAALAVPPLLAMLGLAATCLAPEPAISTPPDWLGPHAALRVLRQASLRRQVFGGALPAGLALGTAIAFASTGPELAIGGAALASALLALPGFGIALPAHFARLLAAGLLALAALLISAFGEAVAAAFPGAIAAVIVWPNAMPAAAPGETPHQGAILAALLRSLGVVVALFAAPLLPPGLPAAFAAAALVAGALIARRG